jgi:CRP/FNR family transcriptional regulator, anaerobic regulatory protein
MEMALASLNYIQPLSPALEQHFRNILKKRKYLKREHLLEEEDVCKHIWFIEKGIVGCFYEKSDRMLCSWFMKENDVTTSVTSFFQQISSQEDIIALDDTTTWYITYQELEDTYELFPEFNKHGRKLVTNYYILAETRMRAFHNMPPDEKYRYLVEFQPEIVQRVSVKDMAKYIGMHPDALSRVRGRV